MSKNSSPPPLWFPHSPPIYDIHKTYAENAEKGPFFAGDIPERPLKPREEWVDFLGFKVASRIGIPAGPLLTSRWIELASSLGFDLLTYKTIRSEEHPAHPLPNMVFVQRDQPLLKEELLQMIPLPPRDIDQLAVTNSFGMPSKSPEFLKKDIPRAKDSLKPGQVLIVSVVGSSREGCDFLQDFIRAALLAKESGAEIIEANFSCPNVGKKEGCLYISPEVVYEFGSAIAKAIHPLPLILKMGLFPTQKSMRETLCAAARANVRAVCGINTVSSRVIDQNRQPALGPDRPTSGICGGPIRNVALSFIRDAAQINREERLGLTLIGCGGITLAEHFDLFFESGADFALTATGMMWDPYLALRYHYKEGNRCKH
jgi:dihydroorotate dehydrogenase (NAD+) catalytic subunit